MKKIDNSIDKYFENAKNFKSPISIEKARILIEESDFKKDNSILFQKPIGLKIMSTISIISVLMYVLISQNIFNYDGENSNKSVNAISVDELVALNTEKTDRPLTSIKSDIDSNNSDLETVKISSHTQNQFNAKENSKIQGINTIELTPEELKEFGINIHLNDEYNKFNPGIGFWNNLNSKAAMYSTFYKLQGSTHKQAAFPLEKDEKLINLAPDFITDFHGKKHYGSSSVSHKFNISEFEPFSQSLNEFVNLEFNGAFLEKELTEDLNKKFNELNELFIKIRKISENYFETAKKIDTYLQNLNKYFSDMTSFDINKNNALQLTPADSNFSSVMAVYVENEPDESEIRWKSSLAKMGVKLVFQKIKPVLNFLETKYPDLVANISFYKIKFDNFLLINDYIAMEVLFDNKNEKDGLIFWFYPSQTLINALPKRYRESLSKEFKYLTNEEAICGAKIDSDKLYLDIWRACSGAIENLRIFPNPIQNEMHIKFELKENRNIKYELYDINGNKIEDLFESRNYNSGSQTALFDFKYLKPGMYLFVVKSNMSEKAVQRFIKE